MTHNFKKNSICPKDTVDMRVCVPMNPKLLSSKPGESMDFSGRRSPDIRSPGGTLSHGAVSVI